MEITDIAVVTNILKYHLNYLEIIVALRTPLDLTI